MENMELKYDDLPTHTLALSEWELDIVYNMVYAERKRMKELIYHMQYLGQSVSTKEYERLEKLYLKLSVHHCGAKNLNE